MRGMTKDTGKDGNTPAKIWHVKAGPFYRDEVPDAEKLPWTYQWMLKGIVEENGEVMPINLWYSTEEEAQAVLNHFQYSMEPIYLEGE